MEFLEVLIRGDFKLASFLVKQELKEIYDMFNLLDNMQNVTIDKFYKFETAGGGGLPYFDESQPPGIPPCWQSGGNEKIPKTQLDYNNQG